MLLRPFAPRRLPFDRRSAVRDYTISPFHFLGDRGHAIALLIRKRLQGRTVNGWLVTITVVGALIVVADGLTRPAKDWDPTLLPPFDYEPSRAAILFAAVTLPLMFAYAKTVCMSLTEGFFLWFTLCTTTYTRDFSYLRLPGAPFFVTDIVLVVILFSVYILPRARFAHNPLALNLFLAFFVGAGTLTALRGFWGHGESILVLRDSALVAYVLFLAAGYHLFRSWLSIKRAGVWFLLGTGLSVLNGLAWFLAAPEQRRFVFPGIYVLVSLVVVLVLLSNRAIRPIVGWILAGVFSLGLLLANARSLFVSLVIVFAMVSLVPRLFRGKGRLAFYGVALVGTAVLWYSVAPLFLHRAGPDFTIRVADDLRSGVLHPGEDPTWQFRLSAWEEAWRRFREYPPAGEGFGIPFTFEFWGNDPRPHNTFVTVLYKMGLIGFLPLLVFLGYFFWCLAAALHHHRNAPRAVFLQVGCAFQVSFCLFGMANLLLESPYLASLFWTAIGVDLRMIRKLDFEQLVQNYISSSKTDGALAESGPGGEELERSE